MIAACRFASLGMAISAPQSVKHLLMSCYIHVSIIFSKLKNLHTPSKDDANLIKLAGLPEAGAARLG
jgi:hypothetical protein